MPDAGKRGSFRQQRRRAPAGGVLLAAAGLLAGLAVACGVPISAEQLALTPTFSEEGGVSVERQQVSAPAVDATPTVAAEGGVATNLAVLESAETPTLKEEDATPAEPAAEPTDTPEPAATAAPEPTATVEIAAVGGAEEAIQILNDYRVSHGLPALNIDPSLMASAANYARLMAESNWFYCGCDFHHGPDGSTPSSRVAAAGYTGRYWGEALSGGQGSAQGAINAWFASPAHAAILLDSRATDVGVGHYYTTGDAFHHYWALVTGTR